MNRADKERTGTRARQRQDADKGRIKKLIEDSHTYRHDTE